MRKRIALIGAGSIGKIHAANLHASETCDLVAIVDVVPGAAETLTSQFGGVAMQSVDQLFSLNPDAVIIASSTASHGDVARACIEHQTPFLCEKPLAFDLNDGKDIQRRADEEGVICAMGLNRRFDPQYRAIRDAVQSGQIGQPEIVSIVSRSAAPPTPEFIKTSGGLFSEKGSHFYDLARWIIGEDPIEVSAVGSVMVDPGFRDVGEVDTAIVTLRFPSGALAALDFSWRSTYGQDERLEVHASRGTMQTFQTPISELQNLMDGDVVTTGLLPDWRERFAPTYKSELEAFIAKLEGNETGDLPTLADGLAAQIIAEAARASCKSGQPVNPRF